MSSNPLDNLLDRLDKVKRSGKGYMALCPAHSDKTPSLSVTETQDGRLLVHCHGGCPTADVMAAVGLELKDLFPDSNLSSTEKRRYASAKQRRDYEDALRYQKNLAYVAERRIARGETLPDHSQRLYEAALVRIKKLEGVLYGQ